jgi:chemotaxis protein MotB
MNRILIFILALFALSSCVSKKDFIALQAERDALEMDLQKKLKNCQTDVSMLNNQLAQQRAVIQEKDLSIRSKDTELAARQQHIDMLNQQLDYVKNTNQNLLDRLSDLSVINRAGAESIQQSLKQISEQNQYIKDLTGSIQRKDSLNLVLVMNLKRSLADINDEDVQVEVKKGVVYISLSDKMLFKTGSAVINPRAEEVLGKVARVLKDHQQLDILVEGHTDTVPIRTDCLKDNWDLSVMRATSVVRTLQEKFGVDPTRLTAGGRGEYIPKDTNTTEAGRQINRRTEIIVTPKLDQFFELLTRQDEQPG